MFKAQDETVSATHYWRVRARLPERFGQGCQVLARGKLNSCLVAFDDGLRVVTSRNFVRRLERKT